MPTLPMKKLRYLVESLVQVERGKTEIPTQISLIPKPLFLTTKEGRRKVGGGERKEYHPPHFMNKEAGSTRK